MDDVGLAFSFFNPVIIGEERKEPLKLSGSLWFVHELITFEVHSHGKSPEPVLGIGRLGTSAGRGGVARGKMVGIQTYVQGDTHVQGDVISDFNFIMISRPEPKELQRTDRLHRSELREPVLGFFKSELDELDKLR